jgi:hypothetical protein
MSQVPAVPPNNTLLISLVTVVCIAVIGGILLKRYAYRFLPPMEEPEEFELPAYQDLPPVYQCNEEFVDAGLTGSTDISGEIAAAVTVPIEP